MQFFAAGQANTVCADLVAKADGSPITTGTVAAYLRALSGDNAGKWWRASDETWQASESSAGAMTPAADGHWTVSIAAPAWVAATRYLLYPKESGDLHIPYSEEVAERTVEANITVEATVSD
jgi:hypothetical protein